MPIFDRLALEVVEEVGPSIPKLAEEALSGIAGRSRALASSSENVGVTGSLVELTPQQQSGLIDRAGTLFAQKHPDGENLYTELIHHPPVCATSDQLNTLGSTIAPNAVANLLKGIIGTSRATGSEIVPATTRNALQALEDTLTVVPEKSWSHEVKEISAEEKQLIQSKAGSLWYHDHPNGERQFLNAMISPPTFATESLLNTLQKAELSQQIDSLLTEISSVKPMEKITQINATRASVPLLDSALASGNSYGNIAYRLGG